MKKADCTPEQWAAHLAKVRQYRLDNLEHQRAQRREYAARPEVIEKRRQNDAKPKNVTRRREHNASERAKAEAKARYERRKADPKVWAERIERQRLRRTGFSDQLVAELMIIQDARCAICGRPFERGQKRADHCHDTQKPRGLLCHHCNIIEGMLRGMKLSPHEFAHRLARYLSDPPAHRL